VKAAALVRRIQRAQMFEYGVRTLCEPTFAKKQKRQCYMLAMVHDSAGSMQQL
jgi:hypothetical protein